MGLFSSKPVTIKISESGECALLKFGVSSMQGWRAQMEDSYIAESNFDEEISLFAVFDGHGGPDIAKFCKKYLPKELKINLNYIRGDYKTALEETFIKIDEMLLTSEGQELLDEFASEKNTKGIMTGCTANIVLIARNNLYVANSGDSRAVLFTKNCNVYSLSRDHKPHIKTEEQRIIRAGGYIYNGRVNRKLNLTRAIGDLFYKQNKNFSLKEQIITAFPDVINHKLTSDDAFVLMGCDGIWESGSNKEICELVNMKLNDKPNKSLSLILEEILNELLAADGNDKLGVDNMTAILIKLKNSNTS